MSNEPLNPKARNVPGAARGNSAPSSLPKTPPLYRRIDWITFGLTTLIVMIGYLLTIAPDLTLEDSGELAVGSFYAGVPHPPGYPVWTIYTWLFTVLLPISNIAFRVSVASAFSAATACGLLAMLVSRGSSMIIEGMEDLKQMDRRWENAICLVSGFVGGCLLAFNGFFWSQAIIVEVYCLGVLSLMGVLCCLLRWMYAPHQFRYLYMAAFLFGICFTNHQTLLLAAMGIEVAVLAADRKLGRDLFLFNSLVYIGVLFARYKGMVGTFDGNLPLFMVFNVIGIASLYTTLWFLLTNDFLGRLKVVGIHLVGNIIICTLLIHQQHTIIDPEQALKMVREHTLMLALYNAVGIGLLYGYYLLTDQAVIPFVSWKTEFKPVILLALIWAFGASFYLFMPVSSMTNPPMNWGYARTVDGFFHALSRGQYERTNPTSDPIKFFSQMRMYTEGAVEEFNLVYLLIALVPLFFLGRMQKREKAWFTGLIAIFLCLGVLLVIIMNPNTDKQSRDLHKVFFTASYSIIAILAGYGLAIFGAFLATHYQKVRPFGLFGGIFAAAIALVAIAAEMVDPSYPLKLYTGIFGLILATLLVLLFLLAKEKSPLVGVLGLMALMPIHPVMSHWTDNEQFGHLFGFWFGHDMFTPPDFTEKGEAKKGDLYPEMARDAVLFGGTDPGRFCPTYMIFCESFIPAEKRRDPKFDRRDVYLITQNALADGTYLNYIRAHYNRSTQQDPPFFQEFFRPADEILHNSYTNWFAKMFSPLDSFFTNLGKKVEARRRAEGVYPKTEIAIPSPEEYKRSFDEYIGDAQRRLAANQLEPGEDVRMVFDKVQVSGQVSVMQINGLLTKVIFDKNPTHEFYVEESFPLKWMYPYLTPFGIIMKINREPVPEFTEEIIKKDHLFWSSYSERLCGNWIDYNTPIKEVCDFTERVYRRMDLKGFKGDPKFVRDNDAQKAFSKLRSALGGLYAWRVNAAKPGSAEQQRAFKEADFAFKQAFAFCPYSPEAVFRYVNLLVSSQRIDDAILITETCQKIDPENGGVKDLLNQLYGIKGRPNAVASGQQENIAANVPNAFNMVAKCLNQQQTNQAYSILDQIIGQLSPQFQANSSNIQIGFWLAQAYSQRGEADKAAVTMDLIIGNLDAQHKAASNNAMISLQLVQALMQRQQTPKALEIIDSVLALPKVDVNILMTAAQQLATMGNAPKLEICLQKLVQVNPTHAEAWYDLAALQCVLGKTNEGVKSLAKAVELSRARVEKQPGSRDLGASASNDPRFQPIRGLDEYKKIVK